MSIADHVIHCPVCNQTRENNVALLPVLKYPVPSYPWAHAYMDILGFPLRESGFRYCLDVIDAFMNTVN